MSLTFIPTDVFTGLSSITQPLTVPASTLREAIAEVDKIVPGFASKVCTPQGQLRSSIYVTVRNKRHSYQVKISDLDKELDDEAELLMDIVQISGG